MRTSLEEGIKLHPFAGIFPEQFSTEAGRHREAVVAADQRMVIRCFRDDLAGFVHDVSHVPPPIQRAGLVDAPFWRHHEGRDRQLDAAEHLKGRAYHEAGHAVGLPNPKNSRQPTGIWPSKTLRRGTEFLGAETGGQNRAERPQVSPETERAERYQRKSPQRRPIRSRRWDLRFG